MFLWRTEENYPIIITEYSFLTIPLPYHRDGDMTKSIVFIYTYFDNLKEPDILATISSIAYKGNTFWDFPFTFRYSKLLLKRGLPLKERIGYQRSKFFPLRIDPFSEGSKYFYIHVVVFIESVSVILNSLLHLY